MIISVRYTNFAETEVAVVLDGGKTVFSGYPSSTRYDAKITAWVAAGNVITPYSRPLSKARSEKIAAIEANYKLAESAPVTLGAFEFDADSDAQSEVMAVLFRVDHGDTLPVDWSWPDVDGIERPADAANMVTLFKSINNKHQTDRRNKHSLTKQAQAASTVAEVELIPDW